VKSKITRPFSKRGDLYELIRALTARSFDDYAAPLGGREGLAILTRFSVVSEALMTMPLP
jgi:hypothetical protein